MAATSKISTHSGHAILMCSYSFLIELRNVAVNRRLILPSTLSRMKKAPILLCSQRKLQDSSAKGHKRSNSVELDEEDWVLQYDLRKPDQVVIADDTHAYQFFGDSIFCAPQEDLLEGRFLSFAYQVLLHLLSCL